LVHVNKRRLLFSVTPLWLSLFLVAFEVLLGSVVSSWKICDLAQIVAKSCAFQQYHYQITQRSLSMFLSRMLIV
jgi:hypothetical protein